MNYYEKPLKRTDSATISERISALSNNPFLESILQSVSGLVAVLDSNRQVLSANLEMLKACGVKNPETILGLRPGEVLGCIRAQFGTDGCGTSEYCSTCGAAIAMVTAMQTNTPCDKTCAIEVMLNGIKKDLCFLVSAFPVEFSGTQYILLFMRDITDQQRWAAVESVFFHDLNNILAIMMGVTDLYQTDQSTEFGEKIRNLTLRIKKEIDLQRILARERSKLYSLSPRLIQLKEIAEELKISILNHSCAQKKELKFEGLHNNSLTTDYTILMKILTNLLLNAFEASLSGDTVTLSFHRKENKNVFSVHNPGTIPEKIQLRIFQRNFSTKNGNGRGLGTYSAKLFTEQFLGGTICFNSDKTGTTFTISL